MPLWVKVHQGGSSSESSLSPSDSDEVEYRILGRGRLRWAWAWGWAWGWVLLVVMVPFWDDMAVRMLSRSSSGSGVGGSNRADATATQYTGRP
jgi:hypothetical protein